MGLLVDGVWRDEQHGERAPTGRFLRPTTHFRNWVTEATTYHQPLRIKAFFLFHN